jgi:flagellar FliL protein
MNIRFEKENGRLFASFLDGKSAYVVVLSTARLLMLLAALGGVVMAGLAGYWLAAGPDAFRTLFEERQEAGLSQATIDLPELIINLRPDTPSRFLQIGITLVAEQRDRDRVAALQPQLVNALQDFLRNLDQDDLQGSAGLFRLRNELRRRFNLIAGEEVVADVLLRSLLTQ